VGRASRPELRVQRSSHFKATHAMSEVETRQNSLWNPFREAKPVLPMSRRQAQPGGGDMASRAGGVWTLLTHNRRAAKAFVTSAARRLALSRHAAAPDPGGPDGTCVRIVEAQKMFQCMWLR
jgi:hypothetical protein